ncbi:MAG: sulfur carrier protein ThiS [Haloechinothrix sp.]
MEVEVNGDQRQFSDGITLVELLTELGTTQRGVAVAVDGEVIARGSWPDVVIADGARVEILVAVQGG